MQSVSVTVQRSWHMFNFFTFDKFLFQYFLEWYVFVLIFVLIVSACLLATFWICKLIN